MSHPVQATGRTIELVEELLDRGTAGVTELATALDISKGAAHNHLQTLAGLDLVVQTDDGYRVGTRFLEFGARARQEYQVFETARQEVTTLARTSGGVASLVVPEHGHAVYLTVRGDNADETPLHDGFRRPLHASTAGKTILAHRSSEQLQTDIEASEPPWEPGSVAAADFQAALQTINEQGVAFDRGSETAGIHRVAAPLTDADGEARGALSVAGPADRLRGKRLDEDVAGLVVSSAQSVSVDLLST
jgi:DNA-binding IclR family transcriptional regulator